MKIKFPTTYRGRNCEKDYLDVMSRNSEPKTKDNSQPEPISVNADINKSDYIQIPNQNFVIAIAETDKNLNYGEAHKAVLERGLIIPRISQFMTFHDHFIDCYKNQKHLFDAGGNNISNKIREDLYKQLTSDCWTWLNGKFSLSDAGNRIEYVTGLDSNKNIMTQSEPLEDCLMQDKYVDFTQLNKQGIPKKSAISANQSYSKAENIYFWNPRNERVARFFADDVRAYLYCDGNPSGRVPSLGVRVAKQLE